MRLFKTQENAAGAIVQLRPSQWLALCAALRADVGGSRLADRITAQLPATLAQDGPWRVSLTAADLAAIEGAAARLP